MKNLLKENWIRIVSSIVVVIVAVYISDLPNILEPTKNRVERAYVGAPISTTGDVTCSYPQVMTGYYIENKITYEISPPESNPTVFTFSDIGKESAKLKYIDATRTISEDYIVKFSEDDERIVFIQADRYYIALHTIFKKTGVSIFSKQASLLGIPSGSAVFGTCIES